MVWPLISGMFGQVSLISLLVNALVLWTVPITTVLGIPALLIPIKPVWMTLFPFCDFFIRVVNFFSKFGLATVEWKMPMPVFVIYYLLFLVLTIFVVRSKDKDK